MINKTLLIWWVDDETNRLKSSALSRIERPQFDKNRKAEVIKIQLKDEQQRLSLTSEIVRARTDNHLPDIVIIDQILNGRTCDGVVRRGSSVAVELRTHAPTVPIVGVSAASLDNFTDLQKNQFTEFFTLEDIQSGKRIADLFAIADGFICLDAVKHEFKIESTQCNKLFRLLDCPKEDIDFLSSCFPGDFLPKWDDETPHSFARWIWHDFIGRPGFLYNELETATLLGITASGMQRIATYLSGCEYQGVFNSTSRPRWWVSKVRQKVRKATHADITEPLWKLGRQLLPKNSVNDYSRCHGHPTRDCVPDVVAYADGTKKDLVQSRSGDTKAIPTDTPPLGFEPRRVYCNKA
jgi:hypothetical protein